VVVGEQSGLDAALGPHHPGEGGDRVLDVVAVDHAVLIAVDRVVGPLLLAESHRAGSGELLGGHATSIVGFEPRNCGQ